MADTSEFRFEFSPEDLLLLAESLHCFASPGGGVGPLGHSPECVLSRDRVRAMYERLLEMNRELGCVPETYFPDWEVGDVFGPLCERHTSPVLS